MREPKRCRSDGKRGAIELHKARKGDLAHRRGRLKTAGNPVFKAFLGNFTLKTAFFSIFFDFRLVFYSLKSILSIRQNKTGAAQKENNHEEKQDQRVSAEHHRQEKRPIHAGKLH